MAGPTLDSLETSARSILMTVRVLAAITVVNALTK